MFCSNLQYSDWIFSIKLLVMFEMKLYQTGVTEIRGKILNPLGIHFYWWGLKNPFLHLKLYVGWSTFHWRDSNILFVLDGIQIFFLCLEGFRYSSCARKDLDILLVLRGIQIFFCARRDSDILLVLGGIQIFFLCSEGFRYSFVLGGIQIFFLCSEGFR